MRICLTGFYGYGNIGDEGILHSILDSFGTDHEFIVSTSLPFTLHDQYLIKLPRLMVESVRDFQDTRTDFDLYILGGGGLSWGYGWKQLLATFIAGKPCMNYGVGYRDDHLWSSKLLGLYREGLSRFDAITVRDENSQQLLKEVGVNSVLTMCPSINLKEEEFDCPKDIVVACPRYEDVTSFEENMPQINWFVKRLKEFKKYEVMLIPFAPYDREDNPIDLAICRKIAERLGGVRIFVTDGFNPEIIKYAISRSRLVISGGRYHPLVWAASHNVPFEVYPKAVDSWGKIRGFLKMYEKYGDKLKEMEKKNKEIALKLGT